MAVMERRFDPDEPELMDRPAVLSDEWRRDLENLRSLNRYFGSYRIIRWYFAERLVAGDSVRVLDLATGSADIPKLIVDLAREAGVVVEVDAVELHPATLAVAEENLGEGYPEVRLVCGDLRTGEGIEGRYDFVLCSLALHHFSEADAVVILRRMRGWATRGVLVADLERAVLAMVGIYVVTATLYRDPMTVTDGRMSAWAAFSRCELERMAGLAGWGDFGFRRFLYGRQAVWLDMERDDGK